MNVIHWLDEKKERKIILVSAVLGIVMFILYVKSRGGSAGGGSSGSGYGGGSTGSGGTDYLAGISEQLATLGNQISNIVTGGAGGGGVVQLDYTIDKSHATNYSSTSSSGSGINIGAKGFNLGWGSSNSSSTSFSQIVSDIFSNKSAWQGLTDKQQTEMLDFFKVVGGTYDQHSVSQQTTISADPRGGTRSQTVHTINTPRMKGTVITYAGSGGRINGSSNLDI